MSRKRRSSSSRSSGEGEWYQEGELVANDAGYGTREAQRCVEEWLLPGAERVEVLAPYRRGADHEEPPASK